MAIIKPFKAIRPTKDKVAFVTSRSYQDYSENEVESVLRYNPFSFLHIINPGYKFSKEVSGEARFKMVHNRYLEFLEGNIFLKDSKDSFYMYQIEKHNFKCCGFFCAASVQDYRDDIIKKHEDTISQREQLFAKYLKTVGFNAEPVLITYSNTGALEAIIDREKKKAPAYYFTTPDKITHTLWVISDDSAVNGLIHEFSKMESLYIADGHHRSASSSLLANIYKIGNSNHTGKEPYNYFMCYMIPESEIQIYEFNRMVKDLNGYTKEEFLIRLDALFRIEKKGSTLYKPTKKHHFSMYLDGDFYSLFLRKKVYKFTDVLSRLDTQILYKTILEPILGITDLRTDKRIAYGFGKHNIIRMKDEIDQGRFKVGFSLVPLKVDEIKAIADAGLVMPPKSTYIEPKLRSGLAIYEF